VIAGFEGWVQLMGMEFTNQYRHERINARLKTKILLKSGTKNLGFKLLPRYHEYRFLPERYQFQTSIQIFPDFVIVNGSEANTAAVVIGIPAMVDVFKSVFEIMWHTFKQ